MTRLPQPLQRNLWLLVFLTVIFAVAWQMPALRALQGVDVMPLPVHILAETYSIVVAMMVFSAAWNAYSDDQPGNILILACGLLVAGLVDFAHMLSFKGMPDFVTPAGPEKAINFWLAARFVSALAIATVALYPWKPLSLSRNRYWLLAGSLALTALICWAGLYHPDAWPRTFVEGEGLTSFKIGAEYMLVALQGVAALLFFQQARAPRPYDAASLFAAAALTVLSELCFTLYSNVADVLNMLGHVYKIAAYYFVYKAVFQGAVREPMLRLRTEIAERLKAERSIRDSEARYRSLFDNMVEGFAYCRMIYDHGRPVDFIYLEVNGAFARLTGLLDVTGKKVSEVIPGIREANPEVFEVYSRVASSGQPERFETYVLALNLWFRLSVYSTKQEHFIVVFDNITERKQAEDALLRSERQVRLLLESTAEAIYGVDPDGICTFVNPACLRLMGYEREEEVLGGHIHEMFHHSHADGTPYPALECRALEAYSSDQGVQVDDEVFWRKDGSFFPVEYWSYPIRNEGKVEGAVVTFTDITERLNYQAQLERQANYDPLTGLANRNLLTDRMEQAFVFANRAQRSVAVMLLDLDRFKLINDSLGHTSGDDLLKLVAERLRQGVRPGDTVARMGGDEFMVVMSDMASGDDAANLARNLLNIVAAPLRMDQREVVITASLGVALYPKDGNETAALLRNADIAMYRAKELGRNSFQFYAPEMNSRMLERLELEAGLRRALECQELELYYQPKVEFLRGQIVGAEGLIRWHHPVLGMVSPADFIPLAEETGLIVPIGEKVIEAACAQLRKWRDAGFTDISLAVNVSARQFQQANLATVVSEALRQHGVPAQYLDLEVTESAVMQNPEQAAAILHSLKNIGVRISLDDFGTGYSSLAYLKRFPIDTMKIDQSFVRDITTDPDDAAIARSVISLAHSLRLNVVAEGVETEAQLSFLRRHHCDEMQGFFFSRPIPAEDFTALLREGRAMAVGVSDQPEAARTLLLVDDEANILSALQRLLRRDGYHVLTAGSAAEGLELLALNAVQVIVSDQRMPQMSGTEFLSRVRDMYPDTVRMVLSGYTDLKSVTDAINHGAIYKFLSKPWDDAVLREHIREAFRYHEAKRVERDRTDSALELPA